MAVCFGAERNPTAGMSTALPSYSFENIGNTSFAAFGSSVSTLPADSGRYIQDDLTMSSVLLPNGSSVPLSSLAANSSVLLSPPSTMDGGVLMGVGSSFSQSQQPMAVGQMNDAFVSASDSLNLGGTVSGTLTSDELTQYLQSGSVLTEMRSEEFLRQFEGIEFQPANDSATGLPLPSSEH